MKIVKPSYCILSYISSDGSEELKRIELAARTCYKSEDYISDSALSAKKLIRDCIERKHFSVLEHGAITVKIVCDRGVSHELVRHRLASYSQESTRYCNYGKDKFGNEVSFVKPLFFQEGSTDYEEWVDACNDAEQRYFRFLGRGRSPQEARAVLNNSLKTEVVMTANYREWREIFKQRCSDHAHPQMREIMRPLLWELKKRIPVVFDDITF